ncbi:MAG: hypothetical protein R6U43_00755 [Candidatus Krumholzibacteriales bacterium]
MFKKAILAAVIIALIVPAAAMGTEMMKGRFALGYYSSDAPLAMRYWATDNVAIDAGIGLSMIEVAEPTESDSAATSSTFSFWFEAGVPIKIWDYERSHFFLRPGVIIGILDDREFGTGGLDETWTQVIGQIALGAEVFLTDNFSIDANHGFNIIFTSPPDVVGDSTMDVKTFGNSVTNVGFHFYF